MKYDAILYEKNNFVEVSKNLAKVL